MRRKAGEVVCWLLDDRGALGNGCLHLGVKGLLEAHVEEAIARNLEVPVDEAIALDVIAGHGSRSVICSHRHSEEFNLWCDGREGRKTQMGWGDLESDRIPRYLTMGRTMLLPEEVDKVGGCGWVKIACYAG